ncbi:protein eyes shut homolog isoform X2 [Poecilia reticulata]|uniref:protein eyes shut homolog isoform X2 n=1 Tax=Poecilia reticulata TaxID=8081 RepID=UPI0007EA4288|nr:PREDICTED: protein eyes shut homolog isoform X2 [Poecilia reticulata]
MWASLFHLIAVFVAVHITKCQTVCNKQAPLEWYLKKHTIQLNWTLIGNICENDLECWGSQGKRQVSEQPFSFPQICPLQLQHGDKLLMSADETLKTYGIRIFNVSREDFESCTTNAELKNQFVFPHNTNESEHVEAKWITPGHHYFIALHEGDSQLCKLGLRLNVSVKTQLCRASPLLRLCSGNGVCRTDFYEGAYHCRCNHLYFGRFCERFDACLDNPCQNKGICLTNGSTDPNNRTYKCLCPPHFTGVNCSEIIGEGNCQTICEDGTCVQLSPVSFKCICASGFSGPYCEKRKAQCEPNPCRNDSGSEYACADGTLVPECRRQQSMCSPSPCLNNGTFVSRGKDFFCRCLSGFSGKNCEGVIDYCRLLNINCLNEGLCLSIIGGYQCVCTLGWIGEFCQHVGDACLIRPDSCLNGATCISTSQPTSPPEYYCKCPPAFTGAACETEINECDSNPCQHNGNCSDLLGDYICQCPTGFQGKNCEIDIDACSLPDTVCHSRTQCLDLPYGLEYTCRIPCPTNLQPCAHGGRCVLNNASSYMCICAHGWSGQNCRINVNDCVQHWCQNGATCVDEIDGYSCLCPSGYTGVYCEQDIDYCVDSRCSEHGVCLDQRYNFTCRCMLGYEGPLCDVEANECNSFPCSNGATCEDLISDYRCHCPPGFEGRTCSQNVNDCWSQPCLNGGSCVDLINDYICHCPLGFKGKDCSVDIDLCSFGLCSEHTLICSESRDGQNVSCTCEKGYGGAFCEVNLNECESKPCQNGGICVDDLDQYRCLCSEGFGGFNCEINRDECVHGYCANNSTCIDLVADYECICPSGFGGKNCSISLSACTTDPHLCRNGGTCFLSYTEEVQCICPLGYSGGDCSSSVNQCVSNPCDPEGTILCEELKSTYRCVCHHGNTGTHCETPINHCVDGLCQHGSVCVDLSRGFKCDCLPGLTGQFCEINNDDCELDPCGLLSICKDSLNGYNCFCAPGFIGNNCEIEVNECLSHPCENGGSCIDELNSFSCDCPAGITGNFCEVNIDECISSPCQHNATCVDLLHGYKCVCKFGFTGTECELDIDECASSPCKNGATCIDLPGNYFCQCVAPFKGYKCEFLPCEASNPCENGAVCVEELDQDRFPLGFRCHCRQGFSGPRCEINVDECSSSPCFHGFCYDVVDGFYCLCSPGYAGLRCEEDIDDCVNSLCSPNSVCKDLHQSYDCVCQSGWEGKYCQREIDECLSLPCKNNATCTDLLDGYKCFCSPGWTGVDCAQDVNECDSGPCLNGARCTQSDIPGEFSCTCSPFFTGLLCDLPYDPCDSLHNPCLHDSTCLTRSNGTASCRCSAGFQGSLCEIDTNECGSNPCQNHGKCVDQVNGFRCDCQMGFSGLHCEEDINECASNPCSNAGICQDLVNNFHCVCPSGYFGVLCDLDVNECEVSPCLHEGICINTPGGFKCICRPGYTGLRCEVNINECISSPCQNGGRCIDGPNQYHCWCPDGLIGLHCESNVDECMSAPCLHGSCKDGINSYTCFCETGWIGSRCETNIDDCALNPCLNGGSCVDLIDKYACFCLDGFTGKTCENDIDVCRDTSLNVPLCFNGATCLDGEGSNFTCICPPGFMGDFCEVDVNECCSAPCQNSAVCQDLINSYVCHCRSGWTGLHCEDDINECLPQPCNQGICIQNDPGYGYTCFCRPGFVGRNCEHNYDDCLLNPCPEAFSCVDGINKVSCLPPNTNPVPLVTPSENITSGYTPRVLMPALTPVPKAESSTDSSYLHYFGNSYLEFQGVDLGTQNNIAVRFQTTASQGTLLYVDQGPINGDFFFMKLFIQDGVLQYAFCCNEEDEVTRMSASSRVDDGRVHIVHIRQNLTPCEAELTLSGNTRIKSTASNYWLGHMIQRTNHVFVGGLRQQYIPNQKAKPLHNYTGCIEVIEINHLRSFYTADAVAGSNIEQCRYTLHHMVASTENYLSLTSPSASPTTVSTATLVLSTPPPKIPLHEPKAGHDDLCHNGGTFHQMQLHGRTLSSCHCPLHFTGSFCEKDTTIYIPSFDGTSYLELKPLLSLPHPLNDSNNRPTGAEDTTFYLTVKTRSTQGTVLFTQEQNFGDRFLHMSLEDGRPIAQLGCGGTSVLHAAADKSINNNRWMSILIRFSLPVGKQGGSCRIEIAADNGSARHLEELVSHPVSERSFGPIFLGDVSSLWELHDERGKEKRRFIGCIKEFQVNSKEIDLVGEAVKGRNIKNCDPPVCQHLPCRNGGTCVSDADDWFCECPPLHTGRLCQLSACERGPCSHGATCIPKSQLEAVCLCPSGRQGLLCDQTINITRARFSGTDEFGYTSFVAYTSIPSLSFFYEFKLRFTLANNSSAARDNLILFAGQKGQGNDGDDFLVLGLRSGRVVHRFNLGSGIATIASDRLNYHMSIHTVIFGRSKRTGWLKVDGQRNRTGYSPGPLVGLNVFNQLFVGGYNEFTPELLPLGSRFRQGFQGCIFDVQFRTRRDGKFQALGQPAGHPAFGRSVGQCGVTPCVHVHCKNAGTCVDSGSSVYCQCPPGWKGTLCSETVSVCDPEHRPPPLCAHGSTCIPLPNGYTCQCPLGTAGLHSVRITDPFFSTNQSSWMSFPPMSIRHRTVVELQFQPLSPDGILVYSAQHLGARAGDFFCLSLTSGFVQLRYNLGDGTHVLQSIRTVDLSGGRRWHVVKAGRTGHQGFLSLDSEEVRENRTQGMTTLDVTTNIFVGGVSTLSFVCPEATEHEPMSFTGGLRELIINGRELELTETGAIGGANIEDWDGTACGYKVCHNGGQCKATGADSFICTCPSLWTGSLCNQSVSCVNNNCRHGSVCAPSPSTVLSYRCICLLGWGGTHCDTRMSTDIFRFVGNSHIKYKDQRFNIRNLKFTQVSFSVYASSSDGLIMWLGMAEQEDDDYLAVGLEEGHLKIAVNLGERLTLPVTFRNHNFCCKRWHNVSLNLNRTVIQAFLNNEEILFEDLDPFERYVALNSGGVAYFGGFEFYRNASVVTSGIFSKGFEGSIRNVFLFGDGNPVLFHKNSEGFNIFEGIE